MDESTVISAFEKRAFAFVCALLLLAIILPYGWAWLRTPPGFVYSGLLFNPDDQNVHLGWARQAREGALFFKDNFTHETLTTTEKPLFVNLLCYFIGRISRLTGLPLIWLYHAVRVGFSALALWLFFCLCAVVTPDRRVRLTALLLAAFGCGAGWLQPLFPSRQFIDRPDLPSAMIVEAFFFSSAFVYVLNVVSFVCLATIYLKLLQAHATATTTDTGTGTAVGRPVCIAGFAALVLSNIHTYDVIPLNCALLGWAALLTRPAQQWMRQRLGGGPGARSGAGSGEEVASGAWRAPLIVLLCTLPPLLYQLVVFGSSTEFRLKALTLTVPPHPADLLLSYVLLLPLALYGAWLLRSNRRAHMIMLWAAACLICIFLPLSFGRKMLEGVHLPLSILAGAGLVSLLARFSRLSRLALGGTILVLISLSSAQFVMWCLARAQDNNAARLALYTPPVYLHATEVEALRYLDASGSNRDRAVLCMPYLGNYVPRLSNRVVFIGHWAETLDANRKLSQTYRFYQGKLTAPQALSWLRANRIGLVYTGSYERKIMPTALIESGGPPLPGLTPVYKKGGVRIDRVPN